jgi:hypothetical protein
MLKKKTCILKNIEKDLISKGNKILKLEQRYQKQIEIYEDKTKMLQKKQKISFQLAAELRKARKDLFSYAKELNIKKIELNKKEQLLDKKICSLEKEKKELRLHEEKLETKDITFGKREQQKNIGNILFSFKKQKENPALGLSRPNLVENYQSKEESTGEA